MNLLKSFIRFLFVRQLFRAGRKGGAAGIMAAYLVLGAMRSARYRKHKHRGK